MEISTPTPKKTHNVSWTPAMTEFLLDYLTEQSKLGRRGPSGFRVAVLTEASEAINSKFDKNLVFCNLQYHLKSLKKKWNVIQDLKKMEGVNFNQDTKEIRMELELYQKYIEANPSHGQFINKPIMNYEKMEIIFGNNESSSLGSNENSEPKIENEDEEDSQIQTPVDSRKRKKPEQSEEGESARSEGANKKSGHIKWSPIMTEFLLNYLVEEVKMGHKGSSSFKGNALSNAAQAVNHKFGKKMTTYHVQNHLKTLKRRWKTIQKLKCVGGVHFNDDTKTLEMDFEQYKKYIEENPLEEQFINKPIKMYNEMEMVCGFENTDENNNININKKSIEGGTSNEVSSPDVNIDAADLGLNVDEMDEIPLLPPTNNNNHNDEEDEKPKKSEVLDEDNLSTNMEIDKPSDSSSVKTPRNISWSEEMSEFVLKFLAEQTRMGNKGSNGFKISVINSAAFAINEKFGKRMNFSNVQNHLKTLKRRWRAIQNIKNMCGVIFHHDSKVLEMGFQQYQNHVQENPGHEQFINAPIELYDEMEIVCSNSNYDSKILNAPNIDLCVIEPNEDRDTNVDHSMPIMTIHFNENNLIEPTNTDTNNNTNNTTNNDITTMVIDEGINDSINNIETNHEEINEGIDVNVNNNDNCILNGNDIIGDDSDNNLEANNEVMIIGEKSSESKLEKVSSIVGQMAEALKELSSERLIVFAREIMSELRLIETEFDSKTIRLAQRYLVEHSFDGACFVSYNRDEKIAWVRDFVKDHLGGNVS